MAPEIVKFGRKFYVIKNFDENTVEFNISATDTTLEKALNTVFAKLNSAKSKIQSLNIPVGNIVLGDYKITENFNGKGREQKEIYYVNMILL